MKRYLSILVALSTGAFTLNAAEYRGQVRASGVAVPGATVTASQSETTLATITDPQGSYAFPDLAGGLWRVRVEMPGFATIEREVRMPADGASGTWDLKMLPLSDTAGNPMPAVTTKTAAKPDYDRAEPMPPSDVAPQAEDGLLVNGSVNNGAASRFGQSRAIGNNRNVGRALYNGNIGLIAGNSAFDARSFSLTGQNTPKPAYSLLTGVASLGGPLRIPHLLRQNGPNFVLNYQWTRNRTAATQSGLMPTPAQRGGDLFTLRNSSILDPANSLPFPGNVIPISRISPQAQAMFPLYPQPNFDASTRYNYQTATTADTHQDSWQTRLTQNINRKNQLFGSFSGQNMRSARVDLFGFLDNSASLGLNSSVNWRHLFSPHFSTSLGYQYNRLSLRVLPYFAGRRNISSEAGISGNNQEPINWGPPGLMFSSGIATLSDASASLTRNQTNGLSSITAWNRGRHNLTFGGDFRRQQFNLLAQQNARGSFGFTGEATGSDFAGFLLGLPDTSSIAVGNADKYLRSTAYDAFFTDDFRIAPGLTLNAGLRWDYSSPMTERYNRLVNLDVAPGFSAATIHPGSLLHPDRRAIEPRVGVSWRPFPDSSMVIRTGYGVYYNSSVYLPIATSLAQQPPFSKSFSIQGTAAAPLTLSHGFDPPSVGVSNTYAVDPHLRVGYAQNWNLSLQRDLPAGLTMTVAYLGAKGTHLLQQTLPNTYPSGAANPCPGCPSGFVYLVSGGDSIRNAGNIQVRRRFHNGFSTSVQYAYSKSLDNAALGSGNAQSGAAIAQNWLAQNWLDLRAERGLSNFDQRHLLTIAAQYSTGMSLRGSAMLSGWNGFVFKDWTLATQITAGSGLPETPVYFAAVKGTGVTGSLRPDYTGAPVADAPAGLFLNPAAFRAPAAGQWGSAGRNSITGPSQLGMNASLVRTFRVGDRVSFDLRLDVVNPLNHVTFTNWNTTINSAQFGLPAAANAMRSVQTTLRLRF